MELALNCAETWVALGFHQMRIVSVLDGRNPLLCSCLDGTVVPYDKLDMFAHKVDGCRCTIIGVDGQLVPGFRPFVMHSKPVKNIPKKDRDSLIGQVPASTKFIEWFDACSNDFQKEYLGDFKYNLFKEHNCTLLDFVDLKNLTELSDKELGKKFQL